MIYKTRHLVAVMEFRHGGRLLRPNDPFEATIRDAEYLTSRGKAKEIKDPAEGLALAERRQEGPVPALPGASLPEVVAGAVPQVAGEATEIAGQPVMPGQSPIEEGNNDPKDWITRAAQTPEANATPVQAEQPVDATTPTGEAGEDDAAENAGQSDEPEVRTRRPASQPARKTTRR